MDNMPDPIKTALEPHFIPGFLNHPVDELIDGLERQIDEDHKEKK